MGIDGDEKKDFVYCLRSENETIYRGQIIGGRREMEENRKRLRRRVRRVGKRGWEGVEDG